MPSVTGWCRRAAGRLTPFTSTRHSRHAPTVVRPGRLHSVGMKMRFSRATSRMVWSSRAPTSRAVDGQGSDADGSFTHFATSSLTGRQVRALAAGDVVVVLVAGNISAWSAPGWARVCPSPHRLVLRTRSHSSSSSARSAGVASPGGDLLQQRVHLLRSGAARHALAARFAHAEFHEVLAPHPPCTRSRPSRSCRPNP